LHNIKSTYPKANSQRVPIQRQIVTNLRGKDKWVGHETECQMCSGFIFLILHNIFKFKE